MGTPFINLLTPASNQLEGYRRGQPPTAEVQPPHIPKTFLDAMTVRKQVFVDEQGVPIEFEADDDDARSCHWVVYASVHRTTEPEVRDDATGEVVRPKKSETRSVPIGTVRLVPFPHPPHPVPGGVYADGKLISISGGGPVPASTNGGTAKRSAEEEEEAEEEAAVAAAGGAVDRAVADALAQAGETRRHSSGAQAYVSDRATSMHDGREPYVKLGRLAVISEFRGHGIARLLVRTALEWMRTHPAYFNPSVAELGFAQLGIEQASDIPKWGGLVCCHAQEVVIGAWAKYGFVVDEGMGKWVEEGIQHVGMFQRLDLSSAGQK